MKNYQNRKKLLRTHRQAPAMICSFSLLYSILKVFVYTDDCIEGFIFRDWLNYSGRSYCVLRFVHFIRSRGVLLHFQFVPESLLLLVFGYTRTMPPEFMYNLHSTRIIHDLLHDRFLYKANASMLANGRETKHQCQANKIKTLIFYIN